MADLIKNWIADSPLNKPCPPADCKQALAEQNDKLNSYCETKVKEAEMACDDGATELDIVLNIGKVLSRDRLLNLVWGPGTFVTDRVVDNHIVTLRKKIEPAPAKPRYIVSVRGLGYRFDG